MEKPYPLMVLEGVAAVSVVSKDRFFRRLPESSEVVAGTWREKLYILARVLRGEVLFGADCKFSAPDILHLIYMFTRDLRYPRFLNVLEIVDALGHMFFFPEGFVIDVRKQSANLVNMSRVLEKVFCPKAGRADVFALFELHGKIISQMNLAAKFLDIASFNPPGALSTARKKISVSMRALFTDPDRQRDVDFRNSARDRKKYRSRRAMDLRCRIAECPRRFHALFIGDMQDLKSLLQGVIRDANVFKDHGSIRFSGGNKQAMESALRKLVLSLGVTIKMCEALEGKVEVRGLRSDTLLQHTADLAALCLVDNHNAHMVAKLLPCSEPQWQAVNFLRDLRDGAASVDGDDSFVMALRGARGVVLAEHSYAEISVRAKVHPLQIYAALRHMLFADSLHQIFCHSVNRVAECQLPFLQHDAVKTAPRVDIFYDKLRLMSELLENVESIYRQLITEYANSEIAELHVLQQLIVNIKAYFGEILRCGLYVDVGNFLNIYNDIVEFAERVDLFKKDVLSFGSSIINYSSDVVDMLLDSMSDMLEFAEDLLFIYRVLYEFRSIAYADETLVATWTSKYIVDREYSVHRLAKQIRRDAAEYAKTVFGKESKRLVDLGSSYVRPRKCDSRDRVLYQGVITALKKGHPIDLAVFDVDESGLAAFRRGADVRLKFRYVKLKLLVVVAGSTEQFASHSNSVMTLKQVMERAAAAGIMSVEQQTVEAHAKGPTPVKKVVYQSPGKQLFGDLLARGAGGRELRRNNGVH